MQRDVPPSVIGDQPNGGTRERNPIAKAFQALEYLAKVERPSSTLGEIATGVGLKPSTMHRVLAMLEEEELIHQDANRGRYSLGWRFLHLAQLTTSRMSPRELVRPHLEKLRDQTSETTWFGIYRAQDHHMIFIESAASPHPMRHVRELNTPLSIFLAGASGRLTLALLPKEEQDLLLGTAAASEASQSFVDPAQLELIRKRGYAVSVSDRGGVGIAVPAFDGRERLIGVVGIGMPQARFEPEDEAKYVTLMKQAAAGIASELA